MARDSESKTRQPPCRGRPRVQSSFISATEQAATAATELGLKATMMAHACSHLPRKQRKASLQGLSILC